MIYEWLSSSSKRILFPAIFILLGFLFIIPGSVHSQTHIEIRSNAQAGATARVADWGKWGSLLTDQASVIRISSDSLQNLWAKSYSVNSEFIGIEDIAITRGEKMTILAKSATVTYLLCLGDTGQVFWAKSYGTGILPKAMVTTRDSNLAITGTRSGNPFFMKVDSGGTVMTFKEYSNASWTNSSLIFEATDKGFYLGGAGDLVKVDSAGNVEWGITGDFDDFALGANDEIVCYKSVITVGAFTGAGVVRLSPLGQFIGARVVDIGNGIQTGESIFAAKNGDIFISIRESVFEGWGTFDVGGGTLALDSALNYVGYAAYTDMNGGVIRDAYQVDGSLIMAAINNTHMWNDDVYAAFTRSNSTCFVNYGGSSATYSTTPTSMGSISDTTVGITGTSVSAAQIWSYSPSTSGCTLCTPASVDYMFSTNFLTLDLANTSSNADSVQWDFGDGNSSTDYSPSYTYANPGGYLVCLRVKNRFCGSWDTLCHWIAVGCNGPNVSFSANASTPLIQFTDLSTTGNTLQSWTWDFGDGNSSTSQNPSHIYSAPGNYTVCLTVSDTCIPDTICQQVQVNCTPLNAHFGYSNLGTVVSFSDSSSGGLVWNWDFGDGNTDIVQNPVHIYSTPGQYNICLILSDSCGSDTSCQMITCFVPAGGFSSQMGAGLTMHFAETQTGADSIFWDFGDASTGTGLTINHTYGTTGAYTVTQEVYSACGADTLSMAVYAGDTSQTHDVLWETTEERAYEGTQLSDGNYVFVYREHLMKVDQLGNHIWAKDISYSGSHMNSETIIEAFDGGLVISGYISGDFAMSKFDANGNHLWIHTYNGQNTDMSSGFKQLADSGFVLYGVANVGANQSGFFVRTDKNGQMLFGRNASVTGNLSIIGDVIETRDGGLLAAVSTTNGGSGLTLVKFDGAGNSLWHQSYGSGIVELAKLIEMPDASLMFPLRQNGNLEIVKVDSLGNMLWSKLYNGSGPIENILEFDFKSPTSIYLSTHRSLSQKWAVSAIFDLNGNFMYGSYHDPSPSSQVLQMRTLNKKGQHAIGGIQVSPTRHYFGFTNGLGVPPCNFQILNWTTAPGTTTATTSSITVASIGTSSPGSPRTVSITFPPRTLLCGGLVPGTGQVSFSSNNYMGGMAFTNTSTYSGTGITSWDFGDGSFGSGNNDYHSYAIPGVYTVCMTLSTASGPTSVCQTICAFNSSFTAEANGFLVDFTNSSEGLAPVSYLWKFGDGNFSSQVHPSHVYSQPGNYNVCLITSTACGNDTLCKVLTVDTVSHTPRFAMELLTEYLDIQSLRVRDGNNGDSWIIQEGGKVVRVDQFGNLAKGLEFTSGDIVYDLDATLDGGIVLTGATTQGVGQERNFFVTKLDANLQLEWSKMYGESGATDEYGLRIFEYPDSSFIALGVDLNLNRARGLKLDKSGNILWQKYAFKGVTEVLDAAPTNDNGLIWLGRNTLGSSILYKWNTAGHGVLKYQGTSANIDRLDHINPAADGGFVLTGSQDKYLLKLDASLNILWQWEMNNGEITNAVSRPNNNTVALFSNMSGGNGHYYLSELLPSGSGGNGPVFEVPDSLRAFHIAGTSENGFLLAGIRYGDPTETIFLVRTDSNYADSCTYLPGPPTASSAATTFLWSSAGITNGNSTMLTSAHIYGPDTVRVACEAPCKSACLQAFANFTDSIVDSTVYFTDASSGTPISWSWYFGDGTPIDNSQNPVHNYLAPGNYLVYLAITDTCGTDTIFKNINIFGGCLPYSPTISYTGPGSPSVCDTVSLSAPAGFYSYTWSTGDTSQSIIPTTSGQYIVNVLDSNACPGSDSFQLNLQNIPVTWTAKSWVTQSNDSLFRTITGPSSWAVSKAISVEFLPPNQDGSVKHVIHSTKFVYKFGFSEWDPGNLPGSLDYVFVVTKKKLSIKVGSAPSIGLGQIGLGDTLAISRTGNTLDWTLNGTVIHSISVNSAIGYLVETDLRKKKMHLTDIMVDFCGPAPFTILADYGHDACTFSPTGAIDLTIRGGIPPYQQVWNTADTTSDLDSLASGNYSVNVTDQNGGNLNGSWKILNRVNWTETVGAIGSVDTLTRTVPGSGSWFMSGARSVQVLQPNVDGEMSHVIHATNFSYYLGLASTNPDAGPTMMDYSFHFHLGTLYIREKDGHHQPHGTFQEGDTLSIRRSGSTITYWKDSTQLRNTSTNAGDFLFVDASLYTKDMQVQQVFADFCTDSLPLVISASWQHTDCYPTSTGSVMLSVSGGNPPYGYAWSSGETSPGINGKSAGAYTVTVTDNGGNSELLSFELYNKVIWEGLVGAAANADTVYRIVPGGGSWGASGARSDNKLLANINGRMIHIIHSLSYSYYFGLSDQDTDQSPTTIDYTFYNNKGALKIREEQSGFNQWIGTVAIGDTMVVERNGSTVYYYQNGNLLRSVGVNAAETLRVDVSLYSSSTGLHDLYVDFCDTVAGMKRGLTETNSRENAGILIYPNPALSIVVVIWKGIEEWKLDLLDLPGRVLESREVKGEEMKMDLGRRSSGTYLLRLSAPGQIRYRKLVIK